MYAAFVTLLNMSASAGILIAAVLVLRFLLCRVPKKYICILWAFVALRLVCPFSFSSAVSAYNYIGRSSTPTSTQVEIIHYNGKTEKPSAEVSAFVPVESEKQDGPTVVYVTKAVYLPTIIGIWAAGAGAMALYAAVSYYEIRRQVSESIRMRGNLYLCDRIPSPFILGILSPKIYLPSDLTAQQQGSVIAHEQAHLARLDQLWKPIGYALLCIHWFNPLVWLAYALLCRDIEMACDERVIQDMQPEQKQEYATALLTCSMPKKWVSASPLAFGETDVKRRIRGILNYRKPSFWLVTAVVLVCVTVAAAFLTNPIRKGDYLLFKKEQHPNAIAPQTSDFEIRMGDMVNQATVYAELWQNGDLMERYRMALPANAKDIHLTMTPQKKEAAIESYTIQLAADPNKASFEKTFTLPEETYPSAVLDWNGPKEIALNRNRDILLSALIFDRGNGFFLFAFDNEDFSEAAERLQNQDCAIVIWAEFRGAEPANREYDRFWAALTEAGLIHEENGNALFFESVPAEMVKDTSQEELDEGNGYWYQSAVKQADGSAIYKMTREQYDRNLKDITNRLETVCRNIPLSSMSDHITEISHNDDFSMFTVILKNGPEIDFDEEELGDTIEILARRYGLLTTGQTNREITIRYLTPAEPSHLQYSLRIGQEGVYTVTVYQGSIVTNYGNTFGMAYSEGDYRTLSCLNGKGDLKNIQILAQDAEGEILWAASFPEGVEVPWEDNGWRLEQFNPFQ